MLTGSPLVRLKKKTWNKLKNINKHKNIHGFAIDNKNSKIFKILDCSQVLTKSKDKTKIILIKG